MNNGPYLTRAELKAKRQQARQWRADNRPYFDAIYGPEAVETVGVVLVPVLGKVS